MQLDEQATDLMGAAIEACRKSLWTVLLFSFAVNILTLTPLFYMMNVFDKAVSTGSIPTLVSLAAIGLFLYAMLAAMEWVRSLLMAHIAAKLDAAISPQLYQICFDSESGCVDTVGVGSQPLSDVHSLRLFLSGQSVMVLFDLPWIPFFLLLMFLFHPGLAAVAIICMVVICIIAIFNQKLTTAGLKKGTELNRKISAGTQRNLRNAEVVSALGMAEPLANNWCRAQEAYREQQLSIAFATTGFSSGIKTMNMLVQSVAITSGAVLVLSQAISPGVMIAAAMLLGKSVMPVQTAVSGWRSIVDAYDQYTRLKDLLQNFPPQTPKMPLPPLNGHVSMQGASVKVPGGNNLILRNISVEFLPGTITMILGASGSGKSSLLRTVLGLWPVAAGSSRIDGASAADYNRSDLGPQLGYLPQDIELFDGTVAENIARFGDIDSSLVIQASKDAGVHDLILSLPEGYDTKLNAQKGQLSQGQRQRLALARALYGRPKLLVLDEPNSNLDEAGERALNAAMDNIRKLGGTVLLVSHRQTAIPLADRIVVLENGGIKFNGTRDELLARVPKTTDPANSRESTAIKAAPPTG